MWKVFHAILFPVKAPENTYRGEALQVHTHRLQQGLYSGKFLPQSSLIPTRFQTLKDTKKSTLVKSPSNAMNAEKDSLQQLILNNMLKPIFRFHKEKDSIAPNAPKNSSTNPPGQSIS